MKNNFNVLIFPAGTEIGLEINKSLAYCKDITLFGASSVKSNHASYVFSNYFMLPNVDSINFVEELNNTIEKYSIDYIFPAHDDVIFEMSQNRDIIKAKIVCPSRETCHISRFKSLTYDKLDGIVEIPKRYYSIDEVDEYPVFVKPNRGQGSIGARIIQTREKLQEACNKDETLLILDLLTGEEYTVDCFSDREKGLLFASGRNRIRTRNGISMNSATVSNNEFFEMAEKISNAMNFYGAWFFQVKYSSYGVLKLLEVAPRIPGTMCVSRAKGVNLPLLSIYEQERRDINILTNNIQIEVDRALENRYSFVLDYDSVYVDFDDTIIIKGKVNTKLISFLYGCLNQGKKVILITRHNKNSLYDSLNKYRLRELFDEICVVERGQSKASFITDKKSIFIDDSFVERNDVSKQGIEVFDCSQIEMLINKKD